MREIVTPDKDDVLASSLRRDRREVAAGKEQGKSHQGRRNTSLHADAQEDVKESQYLGRLANEHVVHQYIQRKKNYVSDGPRNSAEQRCQPRSDIAHEAEFVQLSAQRKKHGQPDKRDQGPTL